MLVQPVSEYSGVSLCLRENEVKDGLKEILVSNIGYPVYIIQDAVYSIYKINIQTVNHLIPQVSMSVCGSARLFTPHFITVPAWLD